MPGTMTYVGFDVHARSTHAAAIDVMTGHLLRARAAASRVRRRRRSAVAPRTNEGFVLDALTGSPSSPGVLQWIASYCD
jgi:hypothetical protein